MEFVNADPGLLVGILSRQNSMYFPNLGALMVSVVPTTCGNQALISRSNVNHIFHHGGTVPHHCYGLKT